VRLHEFRCESLQVLADPEDVADIVRFELGHVSGFVGDARYKAQAF